VELRAVTQGAAHDFWGFDRPAVTATEALEGGVAGAAGSVTRGERSSRTYFYFEIVIAGPAGATLETLIWKSWYSMLNALRFHW